MLTVPLLDGFSHFNLCPYRFQRLSLVGCLTHLLDLIQQSRADLLVSVLPQFQVALVNLDVNNLKISDNNNLDYMRFIFCLHLFLLAKCFASEHLNIQMGSDVLEYSMQRTSDARCIKRFSIAHLQFGQQKNDIMICLTKTMNF